MSKPREAMKSTLRAVLVIAFHGFLLGLAMYAAAAFRYEGYLSQPMIQHLRPFFYYTFLVNAAMALLFGLHKMPWRYTGTRMAVIIFIACLLGTASMLLLRFIFQWRVLRSILLLTGILYTALLFVARFCWSVFRKIILRDEDLTRKRVLIVGAGTAGQHAYQLCLSGEMPMKGVRHVPVAFADDNLELIYKPIRDVMVEGGFADIPRIIEARDVHEVILAAADCPPALMAQIAKLCTGGERPIALFIAEEKESVKGEWRLRTLAIDDILGADTAPDSAPSFEAVRGRTVLVTGGAGSMGTALCRQIMRQVPARLVVLDVNENYLTQVHDELSIGLREQVVIAANSIMSAEQVEEVFTRYKPEVVFHAAGYKNRVVVEKCIGSAVRNDVMGTNHVLDAARRHGARLFVHLSSDEAREGTTALGAIKRIEEMSVQANASGSMRCTSVRFGNILGAYGSVVPRMNKQIDQGGPVVVDDPDARRYFVSSKAAAQMILRVADDVWKQAEGGYTLFALDMGKPMRIGDLAEMLIRLRGYLPGKDIRIQTPDGTAVPERGANRDELAGETTAAGDAARMPVAPVDEARLQAGLNTLRDMVRNMKDESIGGALYDLAGMRDTNETAK